MISYQIPLRGLKISTNKIYAGVHWTTRKEIADSCHSIAAGFCRPVEQAGPYPVEISYRFTFYGRGLDTTNCAFLVKCFEDALRAIGVLEEDDPAHVARTVIEVVEVPRKKKKKDATPQSGEMVQEGEDRVEIKINNINHVKKD